MRLQRTTTVFALSRLLDSSPKLRSARRLMQASSAVVSGRRSESRLNGALQSETGEREVSHYHINVFYSDEDGAWVADIPDLQYCSAFGSTCFKDRSQGFWENFASFASTSCCQASS